MNKQNIKGLIIAVLIIVLAGIGAKVMITLNKGKAETNSVQKFPIVSAIPLKAASRLYKVEATGTLKADKEVTIIPQVSGRIVYVSPQLIPGGHFKKGAVLARIEDRDYKLMVEQRKSAVKASEIELRREQARGDIAKREWKLSGESGEASPLAARTLQLESSKLNLTAARSALKQAELQLERTVLRAPFSATVIMENVDVGQVVGPQSQICGLVGNKKLRLELAVPVEALERIQVSDGKRPGARVQVAQTLQGNQTILAEGQVTHVVGEMDQKTRRARVIISIVRNSLRKSARPLMPGAFVRATIFGREEPDVFSIPRKTIRNGDQIWTITSSSTLESQSLDILWSLGDSVYARLRHKEILLMTTPLPAPINGMKVNQVN